jgi:branched-chain amino acid transport system ATP-binding protein
VTATANVDRREPSGGVEPVLVVRGITKNFAGITALDTVDLDVLPGEIVGLIGPNGAGKTTLFNCILGMMRAEHGTVTFDGRNVNGLAVYKRARLGIGRTFQRLELFSGMTVRDHFLVADRGYNASGRFWKDLLNRGMPTPTERARVARMIERLGLEAEEEMPVESLSLAHGRLVELGRALMLDPKLLLLDEPSSGLDMRERDSLTETLLAVQAERGFAVLLVEHDVEMVRDLATRLAVLEFGRVIAHGATDEVLDDDAVRRAYLGDLG